MLKPNAAAMPRAKAEGFCESGGRRLANMSGLLAIWILALKQQYFLTVELSIASVCFQAQKAPPFIVSDNIYIKDSW